MELNQDKPGKSIQTAEVTEEEIDIFRVFLLLWGYKYFIILGTLLFTLIGVYFAITSPPVFYAEAILSPKDSKKSGGVSQLGQLGALGGG